MEKTILKYTLSLTLTLGLLSSYSSVSADTNISSASAFPQGLLIAQSNPSSIKAPPPQPSDQPNPDNTKPSEGKDKDQQEGESKNSFPWWSTTLTVWNTVLTILLAFFYLKNKNQLENLDGKFSGIKHRQTDLEKFRQQQTKDLGELQLSILPDLKQQLRQLEAVDQRQERLIGTQTGEIEQLRQQLKDQYSPVQQYEENFSSSGWTDIVQRYGTDPDSLEAEVAHVSETQASLDRRRQDGSSQEVMLGSTSNYNYWILTAQDSSNWLVPKNGFKFNAINFDTFQALFNLQGQLEGKLHLIKPARVCQIDKTGKWELLERGEIKFSSD